MLRRAAIHTLIVVAAFATTLAESALADQSATVGRALHSVVTVYTPSAEGSAFAYERAGIYLTNAHVVGDARSVEIQAQDGRRVTASVISVDPGLDLARLRSSLQLPPLPVRLGAARIGEDVVAIGSPRGLAGSVTKGIVSATRHGGSGRDEIQTDLALNPGNSGGPLLDAEGRVLGVNRAILRESAGISFAIPIRAAHDMTSGGGRVQSRSGTTWSSVLVIGLIALALAAIALVAVVWMRRRRERIRVRLRGPGGAVRKNDPDPVVRIPRLEKEHTKQWTSPS